MHIAHTRLNNNTSRVLWNHVECAIVGKDGSPDTLHNVTKPLRRPQHQPQRIQHLRQETELGRLHQQQHLNSVAPLYKDTAYKVSIFELKGMFMNETTVGTIARSPLWVMAWVNLVHRSR